VEACARLLAHPEDQVRQQAAKDWCDGEDAVVSLERGGLPDTRYADARFRFTFARIVTHYFRHAAWLEEGQLLREAHRLTGIPGVLIHGRLDLGGPLLTAFEQARAWPGSELIVLDGAGHTSSDLGDHVLAAADRFARTQ
jgi:proline iminopeptidase